MRDRTTRARPFLPPGPTMAARHGMSFNPLNDLDEVEQEPAGCGIRFDQLHSQPIAQAIGFAGALTEKCVAAPGETEMLLLVPVMELVTVSVPVIVWLPAVLSVALNVCAPASPPVKV